MLTAKFSNSIFYNYLSLLFTYTKPEEYVTNLQILYLFILLNIMKFFFDKIKKKY
jgi:hypothetical protein